MILHCGSTHQVFDGLVFPLFSCQCWCGREREATVMAPSPMRDSAISPCFCGCLAFLLPYIPSVSPQSTAAFTLGLLHSPYTSAPSHCAFQGTCIPVWDTYDCDKDYLLISFRLRHISCSILSLKCFSPNPDNCPDVGIGPLLQFPPPPRAGPALLTLLFLPRVPSSYQVLRGSLYSFPVVRYSCLLPAGVLQVLLCLKI